MLTYLAATDLALTYALRRPRLAHSLAMDALLAALALKRPDLISRANDLVACIGACGVMP